MYHAVGCERGETVPRRHWALPEWSFHGVNLTAAVFQAEGRISREDGNTFTSSTAVPVPIRTSAEPPPV